MRASMSLFLEPKLSMYYIQHLWSYLKMFLFNLQLANILHAISDTDSVYKTSVSNLIKVIDDINQRMRYVEANVKSRETTSIDSSVIRHLNMSVEELERQNNEMSRRLDKTNFGLSQLGGQLNLNRNQEVSCNFFNKMITLLTIVIPIHLQKTSHIVMYDSFITGWLQPNGT